MLDYDEKDYEELKEGLRINRDGLDTENILQPNLFFHASEGFTKAVARRDNRKRLFELEIAKLDRDIRDNMTTEGERITEDKVKAQLHLEQDYQRRYKEFLQASEEADQWEALKNAYRQRADMLRNLVQLYISGYFGEVTGAVERRESRERFNASRA